MIVTYQVNTLYVYGAVALLSYGLGYGITKVIYNLLIKERLTKVAAANAAEIPKNKLITTTSVAVASKIVGSKVFDVIAGATPNLLI